MEKIIKQIKIKDNEDSLGELFTLPCADNLLYRYPKTGSLSVHIPCRLCYHFRKELLGPNAPSCKLGLCLGVEDDTVLIYQNGKLSIKQSPKHLKNFLKAVKAN